ncbi:HEAT repeat domain-containing protein [Patescibacteria group bacterium]
MPTKTKTKKDGGFIGVILNKVMNISRDEWSRISISWLLQFFYRMAFVVTWTVLISMYVSRFGILALPYFFIIHAVFRIVGTFIYANIINRFRKENIILFTALIAAVLLFGALLISQISEAGFIFLTLPIISIFFSQLYILNSAFIEDMFSPLESERTFPIIESSETIGGVIGGIFIAVFASSIAPIYLMHMVIVSIIMIVPIILFHRQILKKLPFIHFKKKKEIGKISLKKVKESFHHMSRIPFLKVLFLVILTQWIFHNLLEFQFTSAVFANIGSESQHVEQELTHGLGSLQILFHSLALGMQLLVASRIISSLGIISSLLLHPVVTLLSLGALMFKFGFASAVLAKTNFEMTNIVHKSAYHTSYYAIEPKVREQVREFLEGFVHPLGTLIGMGLLLIFEFFFTGSFLNFSVTALMIIIMAFMLFVLLKNESKYTHISVKNLLHSKDPAIQLNAVEILGQKGHRSSVEILTRKLQQENLNDEVRIKIIETLGRMKAETAILEILDCLHNKNQKVRTVALKALDTFDLSGKHKRSYPFSNYRANDTLKQLFAHEEDNDIKALIIRILTKINRHEIVPFLLKLLQTEDDRMKADCIAVCGNFDDINLAHYLLPYLESSDSRIRAYTIVALWKFKKYRVSLMEALKSMIFSNEKSVRLEGYYAVGEIKAIQEKNRLRESLKVQDEEEKFVAALSLAKMGFNDGIQLIVDAIMDETSPLNAYAIHVQDTLPTNMSDQIQNSVRRHVSEYINALLADSHKKNLEDLDKNELLKLRRAYELVNEHEEVQNINEILNQQDLLMRSIQFNPS